MKSPLRTGITVSAALLHISCADDPQIAPAKASLDVAPGDCYEITISPWPDSSEVRSDSLEISPPPRIQLDSTWLPSDSSGRRIAELPDVLPSVHSFGGWFQPSPDSVRFAWSTGYSGVVLHLGGTADSLTGLAESFYDFRDGALTSARAVRVDCSAPIPIEARAVRRYDVAVPLDSGDSLKVGAQVPASLWTDSMGTGRKRLIPAPVGPFRGAESTRVDLYGDGRVAGIVLDYPGSMTVSELAGRLENLLGPPTVSRRGESIYGDPTESVYWADRYTFVRVSGPESIRIYIGSQRR